MKITKKIRKAILIGIIGITPLLSVPFLSIFYISNYNQVNKIRQESLGSTLENSYDETKNALWIDAFNKATYDPESVLVYSMYYLAVFHRFALISHVMSVLSINPNQKIYIMEISGKNDYSILTNKLKDDGSKKYPNLKVENVLLNTSTHNIIWSMENRFMNPKGYFDLIKKENQDSRIHGYIADKSLFLPIEKYFLGSNLPIIKKNIYDYWSFFNDYESLNLFSDGTLSVDYFNSKHYEYFLKSGIGLFKNGEYENAVNFRKGLKNKTITENDFYKDNNAIMYILSLIVTRDFYNDNSYPKQNGNIDVKYTDSKFFLPTTQFIKDMNNNNTKEPFLTTNNNDFFNPYVSVESNLLHMLRQLLTTSSTSFNTLLKILKIDNSNFDQNIIKDRLKGKKNIVYAGDAVNHPRHSEEQKKTATKKNSDVIRAMYKIAKDKDPTKNIQVVFKGHPGDSSASIIQERLFNQLREDGVANPETWLYVLDPTIMFEIYLFLGIFNSDPSTKTEVELYVFYSTIIWILFADGRSNDIIKIILPDLSEEDFVKTFYDIEGIYGMESPMFNTPGSKTNDKTIRVKDLISLSGIK